MGQLLGLGKFTSYQNSKYPSGPLTYISLLSMGRGRSGEGYRLSHPSVFYPIPDGGGA